MSKKSCGKIKNEKCIRNGSKVRAKLEGIKKKKKEKKNFEK